MEDFINKRNYKKIIDNKKTVIEIGINDGEAYLEYDQVTKTLKLIVDGEDVLAAP